MKPSNLAYFLSDGSRHKNVHETSPTGKQYAQSVIPMSIEALEYAEAQNATLMLKPVTQYPHRSAEEMEVVDKQISEVIDGLSEVNGEWISELVGFGVDLTLFKDPLTAWYLSYFTWARSLEQIDLDQFGDIAYPYSIGYEYDLYPRERMTQIDAIIPLHTQKFTKLHPYSYARRDLFLALKSHRRLTSIKAAVDYADRVSFLPMPSITSLYLTDARHDYESKPGTAQFDTNAAILTEQGKVHLGELLFHSRDTKLPSLEEKVNLRPFLKLLNNSCKESRVTSRLMKQWFIYNLERLVDRVARVKEICRAHEFEEIHLRPSLDPIVLNIVRWASLNDIRVRYETKRDPLQVIWHSIKPEMRTMIDLGQGASPTELSNRKGRTLYIVRPDLKYALNKPSMSIPSVDYFLQVTDYLNRLDVDVDVCDPGALLGSSKGKKVAASVPRANLVELSSPAQLAAYVEVQFDQYSTLDWNSLASGAGHRLKQIELGDQAKEPRRSLAQSHS